MRNTWMTLLLASALVVTAVPGSAGAFAQAPASIVVIAQKGSPASTLTAADVKRLYSGGRAVHPAASALRPLDYSTDLAIRDPYYLALTGRDGRQMRSFWAQLVLSGGGRGPTCYPSAAAIVREILSDPRAIGYVWDNEVPAELAVVLTVPVK